MSTHRQIQKSLEEDLIKKSKMIGKFWSDSESLGEMEGELGQGSLLEESTYFILDAESKAVKIGKTSCTIKEKMTTVQYGNPNKLRTIAVIPRGNIERELHLKFRKYRMRGEWFRYEGELKAYIKNLSKCNQGTEILS